MYIFYEIYKRGRELSETILRGKKREKRRARSGLLNGAAVASTPCVESSWLRSHRFLVESGTGPWSGVEKHGRDSQGSLVQAGGSSLCRTWCGRVWILTGRCAHNVSRLLSLSAMAASCSYCPYKSFPLLLKPTEIYRSNENASPT